MGADESTWLHVALAFIVTVGGYVLSAFYVPRVLLRKREPSATLSWLFVILLFPYGGVLLYILFGNNRVKRRAAAKQRSDERVEAILSHMREPHSGVVEPGSIIPNSLVSVSKNLGLSLPTGGNYVKLYPDGPSAFEGLLSAIRQARHHVHLEFFIFRHDQTGKRVLDELVAAARRGVQVRLLVDSVGNFMTRTPLHFFKPLQSAGGQVVRFLPVGFITGWSVFNLRNHRKMVVVDGNTAFTGGMNVGNEYAARGEGTEKSWRDLMLGVKGPAAAHMQEVFAADWYFAVGQNLADPDYFPRIEATGSEFVQVVASGPDDSLACLHRLTLALIESAREQLYLTTPYFVPDPALASSIVMAALRGVDVRLLVPQRSNHPLVKWAGRSFFEELLEAGVTIHEYTEGMLHAKAIVADGRIASMGSANMDIRSFRLNFEVNTFVYGQDFASQLEAEFVQDTLVSHRIARESFASRPLYQQIAETTARILSPVL